MHADFTISIPAVARDLQFTKLKKSRSSAAKGGFASE